MEGNPDGAREVHLPGLREDQPATGSLPSDTAWSHHWGREVAKLGHQVKLIAPIYVKPFVKRQKNDAADAEAICEAAMRPTMRFVAVKSEEKQAAATVFKVRDLLVRQKTQIINALRGLMAEFGITVPQGPSRVGILISYVEDDSSSLTAAARALLGIGFNIASPH